MKNFFFLLLCCLAFKPVFSQRNIQAAPKEFRKIHFTFIRESTSYIDEQNLYVDTLLIAINHFNIEKQAGEPKPQLHASIPKESLKPHPKDSTRMMFVIPISSIKKENVQEIINSFAHVNCKITGTYDKERNKTKLFYSEIGKEDDKTRAMLLKVFGKTYSPNIKHDVYINYKRNTIEDHYGFGAYARRFDINANTLEWLNPQKTIGIHYNVGYAITFKDVIGLSNAVDRHVTTLLPFGNADGGVVKIKTASYEEQLVSLTYE